MPPGLTLEMRDWWWLPSWRYNSGTETLLRNSVLNPSPAALQPVAKQEDSGGFWRTPVFPAGPLARGPWSLRTLCIMRTPFVFAEQPRREWALQGPPCLTAWDCLRERLGQHSQQLDTGKASPLHPGSQRETWRGVPVFGISGSLVGVHTCD